VSLLGRFVVVGDGQALAGFDALKVQELLSFVLLHRDRAHLRSALAGMLWADSSAAQAHKYLRQALWHLQSAHETAAAPDDPPLLVVDAEWVRLNAAAHVWLDTAELEGAYAVAHNISGPLLDDRQLAVVQAAVKLYRGDLLEGWTHDWCLFEREHLQNQYLILLDKLLVACEARHEYEAGFDYAAAILRVDRAHERTHRRLMRLHYLAGDRVSALRQYGRCTAALSEELGVRPARRTLALYEQIRDDHMPAGAASVLVSPSEPSEAPIQLAEVLQHLDELRDVLRDVRHALRQDIEAIRLVIVDRG
jgi:DNA-binding SARP family transcriptional activator